MNYINDQQSVIITADPNGRPEIEKSLGPIMETIEELNQESQEEFANYGNQAFPGDFMPDQPVDEWGNVYDPQMYENQNNQEEPRAPKKAKKKESIPATSGYANRHKEEKEKLERQFAAKEAILQEELRQKDLQNQFIEQNYKLKLQSKEIDEGIRETAEVILGSKANQDHEDELKGTMLLQKLINQKDHVDRELEDVNAAMQKSYQDTIESEPDPVENYLRERFDSREAESPYFEEFLKNYPACNPYDKDYDPKLADEIWEIRQHETRKLKLTGKSNEIGSASFFRNVDSKIQEYYFSDEPKKQSRKSYKQSQDMEPEYDPQQDDNFQQYPEGEENMNFNDRNTVVVAPWGDHYDEGYAPTRGTKGSNFRDSGTGSYVGQNGAPMGGGGTYNPNHQRVPQGRPQQQQQGYPQQYQPQSYRGGGPVRGGAQPVNRGDYRQGYNNRVALDPVFRGQVQKMSQIMNGMCYPDGTQMNAQEREDYYIDWFSRPENRKNM